MLPNTFLRIIVALHCCTTRSLIVSFSTAVSLEALESMGANQARVYINKRIKSSWEWTYREPKNMIWWKIDQRGQLSDSSDWQTRGQDQLTQTHAWICMFYFYYNEEYIMIQCICIFSHCVMNGWMDGSIYNQSHNQWYWRGTMHACMHAGTT